MLEFPDYMDDGVSQNASKKARHALGEILAAHKKGRALPRDNVRELRKTCQWLSVTLTQNIHLLRAVSYFDPAAKERRVDYTKLKNLRLMPEDKRRESLGYFYSVMQKAAFLTAAMDLIGIPYLWPANTSRLMNDTIHLLFVHGSLDAQAFVDAVAPSASRPGRIQSVAPQATPHAQPA